MPSRIVLSSLAARFYVRDGWDEETVKKYLISPSMNLSSFDLEDVEAPGGYFIMEPGGRMDIKRILNDFPDMKVVPYCSFERNDSREELLESRNW